MGARDSGSAPVWQADPRFRIAVEALLDGLAIYSSIRDEDGRIVDFRCEYANQAVVANGGEPPEEQVGRTMRELTPSIDERGLFDLHVQVVETGEPASLELTWPAADGTTGAFEIHVARLDDGCVIVFRNITERRDIEAALRASEARAISFLQALPAGVIVADDRGPVFFNRAAEALLGQGLIRDLPAEHLIEAYSVVRFGTDEPYPIEELPLRRALREATTIESDDVAIRRPDRDVPIDSFATPLYDDEGRIVSTVAIVHDATERRAQEDRLQAALSDLARKNDELSDFAAHAAHDLAEPLRAIAGFTDLLRSRYSTRLDDEAIDWLELMLDGAGRMRVLIDDLLAYSRAGSVLFQPASVDLAGVIEMAREPLLPTFDAGEATLEVGELPVVRGDASQLVRLFQNLITNAVKFARPDVAPAVTVDACRVAAGWEIRVADNGRGIASEDRDRVFAPFQRVGSDAEPGSGLGLAISRRIAERHGGSLELEPSSAGGACFCVTLPAA